MRVSHNPYQDNGIKFFSAEGSKLPDAVEMDIEARLDRPIHCKDSASLGKARRVEDARGRYIEFCKSTFPPPLTLPGLKTLLNSRKGPPYTAAPHVFPDRGPAYATEDATPEGLKSTDAQETASP